MTDSEAIAYAEQANAALKQFLDPAFAVVRSDYLDKLADIAAKPLTNDMRAAMEKLALAIKVVDQVRLQITPLVANGALARDDLNRAARIAELPAEKRRWAQF